MIVRPNNDSINGVIIFFKLSKAIFQCKSPLSYTKISLPLTINALIFYRYLFFSYYTELVSYSSNY